MKSLEEILGEYFNCEKPFLEEPIKTDDNYEYFTDPGSRAYGKLVSLLYDLEELGVIKGIPLIEDVQSIIEALDEIVSGKEY